MTKANQTDRELAEPLPPLPDIDRESSDLGFNRRIGLGLILSVGANVLLLQGAGAMKNRMNDMPQASQQINVRFASPTPEATPSPTPAPEIKKPERPPLEIRKPVLPIPTPTPAPKKPEPTPAPKPEPRPTPKPEPSVVVPSPPPTKEDKVDVQQDEVSPAMAMATHDVSVKQNRKPALDKIAAGSPKIFASATRSASPAAAAMFTVKPDDVAPVPHVSDLPRQSIASQISAAINSASSAKTQPNGVPGVETSFVDHVPASALAHLGKIIPLGSHNSSVMTSKNPTAANFAMPTSGDTVPAGRTFSAQGGGQRGIPGAAMSGAASTVLAPGGDPMGAVSGSNRHAESGPAGGFRRGHILSIEVPTTSGGDNPRGKFGSGQPGPAGLDSGSVDNGGNGLDRSVHARQGDAPAGIDGNGSNTTVKELGGPKVSEGTPGKTPPSGPVAHGKVSDDGADRGGYGSAVNAVFSPPSSDSIVTPDSLRSTPYNVTVSVRVVLEANGSVRAEIVQSSGHAALDEQVKTVCSRIKFKPAMQDGHAVREMHTFNFNLSNSG